jgi:hypothetical protein
METNIRKWFILSEGTDGGGIESEGGNTYKNEGECIYHSWRGGVGETFQD